MGKIAQLSMTKLTWCSVVVLFTAGAALAAPAEPSVAFFYGVAPPIAELSLFEQVVVEPSHLSAAEREALVRRGSEVFAYFSVGEVGAATSWRSEVRSGWKLGRNTAWDSDILDPSQESVRELLLSRMGVLWSAGYRGFFLDTLDSPLGAPGTTMQVEARRQGLVTLVRELHRRFRGIRLLFNRGFELLPDVASLCHGVAAESLFSRWDAAAKRYVEVPEADRRWLSQKLSEVKERHGLPVVVVDYVPPGKRELARHVARAIAGKGFTPWVTNAALDALGVGRVEPMPRRVLALYDGAAVGDVANSLAHRLLAAPLEHLGYAVDTVDVRALPEYPLQGRYAGVVTWFGANVPQPDRYRAWLLRQLDGGVRVAVFGQLGVPADRALLGRLGLGLADAPRGPPRLVRASGLLGFEAQPRVSTREVPRFSAQDPAVKVLLGVVDGAGRSTAAVLTAPWGGLALDPYVVEEGYGGSRRWLLDPFGFLRSALALPQLPAPDVTTESGRRLLTAQVDGDGFALSAEVPGRPLAGEVIGSFLERHPLPITVSFVEGELSPEGLSPRLSPRLEAGARRIARLPWVELASHSFSHPANWNGMGGEPAMRIPGYQPNVAREVGGSVRYVEKRLAPSGKPVRTFLWPEDALPDAETLDALTALKLDNVNGGFSRIPSGAFSVTDLSPLSRRLRPGGPLQIYRPGVDDSGFAQPGQGTPSGYERVIALHQSTDSPRRLKPIVLAFHYWSGVKVGGMAALEKVFSWAEAQQPLPLWLSEYAALVRDFDGVALGRTLDGAWEVRGDGALRTLRLDPKQGHYPDLLRSRGVAGMRDLPQGRYVALDGSGRATLYLLEAAPSKPHLAWANARVARWTESRAGTVALRLTGHLPVRFAVAGAAGRRCRLMTRAGTVHGQSQPGGLQQFSLEAGDTGDASLTCS
jgi:hypothetical protein